MPAADEALKCRASQIVMPIVGAALLIFFMLYMSGFFARGLVGPDATAVVLRQVLSPQRTAAAHIKDAPVIYQAVGTVRSRTTANVASQVQAVILAVHAEASDHVKKDALLITLDDQQLLAKRNQAASGLAAARAAVLGARQGLIAAQARHEQARSDQKRYAELVRREAATPQEQEATEAQFRQAEAGVEQTKQAIEAAEAGVAQAEQVLREADVALSYTKIKAPMDGIVLQRLADPGDLASPGRPLIVMYDPRALRLEAFVRESLIEHVRRKQALEVAFTSLNRTVEAAAEEIVPFADPVSRTFLVKAALPARDDLYPGMFGRLLIPTGTRKAVLIPRECWQRVGQLDTVVAREGDQWRRIYVKAGRVQGDSVEILAGLAGTETLGIMGREER